MKNNILYTSCALLALLSACSKQEKTNESQSYLPITESTQSKQEEITQTISVPVGKSFTITLPSNRTTGYSWRMVQQFDQKIAILEDQTYGPHEQEKMIGAAGIETFIFQALHQGTSQAIIEYRQWWRTDEHGRKVTINLTVTQ